MRNLILQEFLTVDGMAAGPDGNTDFIAAATKGDQSYLRRQKAFFDSIDTILLGRKTYEIFAAYWPHVTDENLIARQFNSVRKHVVSRTLNRADWNNSTLIKGDPVEAIKQLKGQPGGELQVHGSGELIQTLLKHNLIDELRLWIFPIVLGTGKRLFRNGTVPARFELAETRTSSTGVVLQVHRPAGRPEYGSFLLEEPSAEEIERRRKVVEVGG